jgi:riboflavin synthase
MVLGHVDGVARVGEAGELGTSAFLTLVLSPDLLRLQVPKGSIAVDGVSLTVAEVINDGVRLVLIPETLGRSTLGRLRPGNRVNVETDILGKYVWQFLGSRNPQGPGLSEDLLRGAGF